MKDSVLKSKSFEFALKFIDEYRHLIANQKEYVLSKQLLRSGTSIGANIEEANGAQSKRDFLNKISIAYMEARETNYWFRLLKESSLLEKERADALLEKSGELCRIMSAVIITTKNVITNK